MRLPQILATIAAALLAVGTLNAQTTTMQVNAPYSCGVYSTPTRCYGLPVTVTAGTQVTGPTGSINLSYYASGYKAGSAVGYGVRTVPDYGYVTFNGNFQGLAGTSNPPYPYNAAITAVGADGTLYFQGVDDAGVSYHGTLRYTFSTHYACTGGRGGGCHTSWTITGGALSVTRVDY
jgi:hypothetical protein